MLLPFVRNKIDQFNCSVSFFYSVELSSSKQCSTLVSDLKLCQLALVSHTILLSTNPESFHVNII